MTPGVDDETLSRLRRLRADAVEAQLSAEHHEREAKAYRRQAKWLMRQYNRGLQGLPDKTVLDVVDPDE